MSPVTVVVIIAVLLVAAAVIWFGQRAAARRPPQEPPTPATPPMSSLEAALDRATTRDGHTLREKLDAESAIVDDLRIVDDTGPVLRRALDRVEQQAPPDHSATAPATDSPATPTDPA